MTENYENPITFSKTLVIKRNTFLIVCKQLSFINHPGLNPS